MSSSNREQSRKIFYVYLVMRVVTPFLLWIDPIIGFLINFLLDMRDGYHAARAGMTKTTYGHRDKLLDFWFYIVALVYFLGIQQYSDYHFILVALLGFRFIGEIGFYISGNRKLFVVFPNYYENLFVLVVAAYYFQGAEWILGNAAIVGFVMVEKLIVELILHYYNLPVSKTLGLDLEWTKEEGS